MTQPLPRTRLPMGDEDAKPPIVDSSALLGKGRELIIAHGNDHYRLLLTAQNKLILTK